MRIEDQINLIHVPISQLNEAIYNPRTMTKDEFNGLKESIQEFGLVDPLIINKDFTIIGGHQRLEAAKKLGYKEVPCIQLDLDKHQEKKLNVILNSQAISGNMDQIKLDEILAELKLDDNYEKLRLNKLEQLDLSDKPDLALETKNVIEVTFDSADSMEQVYSELTERGYNCRILTL